MTGVLFFSCGTDLVLSFVLYKVTIQSVINQKIIGIRSQLTALRVQLLSSIALNGFGSYETEFLQKYRLSDPLFELWLKRQT